MEQVQVSGTSFREEYNSLNEYAAYSKSRSGYRYTRKRDARAKHWNGNLSYTDALTMCERGWEAQADLAMNIAEHAVAKLKSDRIIPQPTAMWDVSGAEVDIARFLGNEPECMLEFPPAERLGTGDTVTLVRTFTTNGGTDAADIEKYGRLIASLVLSLEQMGIPVEVWAEGVACSWGGHRLYQRVKIKGSADMLHVGQLMFGLAHPAMLRQVMFASMDDRRNFPPEFYEAMHPDNAYATTRNDDEKALYPEGTLFFDHQDWDDDPVIFLVKQLRQLNLIPQR